MAADTLPSVDVVVVETVADDLPALSRLLVDAVASGASVGFLPPLSSSDADAYWRSVEDDLVVGSRRLLVARDSTGTAVGSVQLDLAMRPNGRHRAEVAKLMVLRAVRRQGLGRALMLAAEDEALRHGRTTLILDTRQGDPSEALYRSVGYELAGIIPEYARSATGQLDGTAIYYRLLR